MSEDDHERLERKNSHAGPRSGIHAFVFNLSPFINE